MSKKYFSEIAFGQYVSAAYLLPFSKQPNLLSPRPYSKCARRPLVMTTFDASFERIEKLLKDSFVMELPVEFKLAVPSLRGRAFAI